MSHPDLPQGMRVNRKKRNKTPPNPKVMRPSYEDTFDAFPGRTASSASKYSQFSNMANMSAHSLDTPISATGYSWQVTSEDASPNAAKPRFLLGTKKKHALASLAPATLESQYQLPPRSPYSPLSMQDSPRSESQPGTPGWFARAARKRVEPMQHASNRSQESFTPSFATSTNHSQHDDDADSGSSVSAASVLAVPSTSTSPSVSFSKRFLRPGAIQPAHSAPVLSTQQKQYDHQQPWQRGPPLANAGFPRAEPTPPTSPETAYESNAMPNIVHKVAGVPTISAPLSRWHSSPCTASPRSSQSADTTDGGLLELETLKSSLAAETRRVETSKSQVVDVDDSSFSLSPLGSHPVRLASISPSSTVRENHTSFSRPELNQHHSTLIQNKNAQSPSRVVYAERSKSAVSLDADLPSPINDSDSAAPRNASLPEIYHDNMQHHDVSPIDEDDDDFITSLSTGPPPPDYAQSQEDMARMKHDANARRAQELQRRWMASGAARR